ncbi:hypothetical protein GJ744_004332 [Endocarpon pusillum]|uniref:CmcJ-like methyltransferase n=1 Tax=Endocarpon pusillum TaxID=364733 RepID=A0A8H7A5M5_9EURO|nr:hypothetical protein GJ744_004332 [Endocarpon pusillum]
MAQAIDTEIQTYMPYLARNERYNKEKPFGADFPVDRCEGGQCANHIFDNQAVTVHNMRGGEQPVLDRHGFCLVHAQTSLTAAEASNSRTPPMERYLGEIERILYEKFPEYLRIEIMDFQVRKRVPEFPHKIGVKVEFEQPATVPHTDFSVSGAFMRMKDIFPGQEEHYENKSFDLINVWRVLKGPNDDWPLALCDFQSVDLDKDVTPNDCLHETGVGENWLLHANDSHRWYFMDWQEEADLIVFRNADSEGVRARAFHAAIRNPKSVCEPRHSIEVRVVAFR